MYDKLKNEMKDRGVTGYALSKQTGISSSSLYRALSGKQQMFNGWKTRIAEALELPVDTLFPEDEKDGDVDEQTAINS